MTLSGCVFNLHMLGHLWLLNTNASFFLLDRQRIYNVLIHEVTVCRKICHHTRTIISLRADFIFNIFFNKPKRKEFRTDFRPHSVMICVFQIDVRPLWEHHIRMYRCFDLNIQYNHVHTHSFAESSDKKNTHSGFMVYKILVSVYRFSFQREVFFLFEEMEDTYVNELY